MLRIEFKTGNAAFRDEDGNLDGYTVADYLREKANDIADDIENGYEEGFLVDINGNKVGSWQLED